MLPLLGAEQTTSSLVVMIVEDIDLYYICKLEIQMRVCHDIKIPSKIFTPGIAE